MNNEEMRIYISGPITGRDYTEAWCDFDRREKQLLMQFAGAMVYNPMKFVPKEEADDWQTAMRRCVGVLSFCTHYALLAGWNESRGCKIEQRLAKELGLLYIKNNGTIVKLD